MRKIVMTLLIEAKTEKAAQAVLSDLLQTYTLPLTNELDYEADEDKITAPNGATIELFVAQG